MLKKIINDLKSIESSDGKILKDIEEVVSKNATKIYLDLTLDTLNLRFNLSCYKDQINPHIKIINNVDKVIKYFRNDKDKLKHTIADGLTEVCDLYEIFELTDLHEHDHNYTTILKKLLKHFEANKNNNIDAETVLFMILEYKLQGFKSQLEEEVIETTFEEI